MSTNATQNLTRQEPDVQPAVSPRLGLVTRAARGAVAAAAIVAFTLTAIPTTARAGNPGPGAAIGLGILGGVLAGAAIASTAPPAYPASYPYYYSPDGYYAPTPGYYPAPQPYYGAAAYPHANYGYYYGR
jgi:hypothetical protein